MASIVKDVFKAIIGFLLDKGQDMMADKLKEGDVTDEKFRGLIVREIDDIKSKLDALARTNLLASIVFLKEGLVYVYRVLDSVKTSEKDGKLTAQGAMGTETKHFRSPLVASVKTVCLAEEMRSFQLSSHDDSTTRALSDAKDRFKQAREKATEAFCNEALSTADRILAMQYRVMATILEKVDNPADALATCRLCLEELHAMPAVQKSFNVQLKQSFKSKFNKAEREGTLRSVCRVNRVIHDVTKMVTGCVNLTLWPCVNIGEEKVDPLRDSRVTDSLRDHGMQHFLVKPWSLVQEGEEEGSHSKHCCVTTNSQGQFIVVDNEVPFFRVFDHSGKNIHSCRLVSFAENKMTEMGSGFSWRIKGIATDQNNRVFLLVRRARVQNGKTTQLWSTVNVLQKNGNLQHEFKLKSQSYTYGELITVSDYNRVFVVTVQVDDVTPRPARQEVQVYDTTGLFLNRFGYRTLINASAMTAIKSADSKIIVLQYLYCEISIHMFNEQGDQLSHFKWKDFKLSFLTSVTFQRVSEHVFVLSNDYDSKTLHVLTKDGECLRSIHLATESSLNCYTDPLETTVSNEGLVVLCAIDRRTNKRTVCVL